MWVDYPFFSSSPSFALLFFFCCGSTIPSSPLLLHSLFSSSSVVSRLSLLLLFSFICSSLLLLLSCCRDLTRGTLRGPSTSSFCCCCRACTLRVGRWFVVVVYTWHATTNVRVCCRAAPAPRYPGTPDRSYYTQHSDSADLRRSSGNHPPRVSGMSASASSSRNRQKRGPRPPRRRA